MPRPIPICWIFSLPLLTACSQPAFTNPFAAPKVLQPAAQTQINQAQLHLNQAEILIASGDTQNAEHHLQALNPNALAPEQRNQFNLLSAQTRLSSGEAEQALFFLLRIEPTQLSATRQRTFFQALAFAHDLAGNPLASAAARVQLAPLLDAASREQNQHQLLEALLSLPNASLSQAPANQEVLAGWMSLAQLIKRHDSGQDINNDLLRWQQRYTGHPADNAQLPTYFKPLNAPQPASESRLAVLLPESGPHAQAALAIKQGILASYQQHKQNQNQVAPQFYDTQKSNIVELYRKALAQGAQRIIGPLEKEELQILAQSTELTVPVLALNHVENLSRPQLYQFGLSPLDDSSAIARLAWQHNHHQALIITPQGSQGQRLGNYLTTAWQQLGGQVSAESRYDSKQADFGQFVKTALQVNGNTRRQDVDVIFLNAPAETARRLYPQLHVLAADIAVYALPQVYGGVRDDFQDADLNNIHFCDAPWLLQAAGKTDTLRSYWQDLPPAQLRLFALGMDAYQLSEHLDELATTPYQGATGQLSLSKNDRRIVRQLQCGQFKNGVAVADIANPL